MTTLATIIDKILSSEADVDLVHIIKNFILIEYSIGYHTISNTNSLLVKLFPCTSSPTDFRSIPAGCILTTRNMDEQ